MQVWTKGFRKEVEDVIPKKEALSEFLNEHYVGIEDNDNDNGTKEETKQFEIPG